MSIGNDKVLSAYLDGELSASEASEFDRALSASEKQRLAGEVILERALADSLSKNAACPDAVWEQLCQTIQSQPQIAPNVVRGPWRWNAVLAAAAVLVLTIAGIFATTGGERNDFLRMAERDVAQLKGTSAVDAVSLAAVNDYVHAHGYGIDIAAIQNSEVHHHRRELLGARESSYRGEKVMELLFDCCGKPLKVVVAPKNGGAARHIGDALARGEVQASRPVGEYVAAVVGQHKAVNLLDLVTETSGEDRPNA
ncbi:MAG: hypothetical protein K1Y02_25460 [Candidatus Hydrogenedentes bacterium]|nr:hypothetical protein [Candidatus Hydrogenedentota bacterium]